MEAEKLIARANNRAAILSNLQKSYGASSSVKVGTIAAPVAISQSSGSKSKRRTNDVGGGDSGSGSSKGERGTGGIRGLTASGTGTGTGAEARAAAARSGDALENKHNAKSTDSLSSSSLSGRTRDSKALDTLLAVIGCHDTQTRRVFTDQLEGKSLVLSNTGKRIRAASASSRSKSQLQRRQKRATDTSLKASGILNPFTVPILSDLQTVYELWLQFAWAIIDSCNSEAQLQARLNTAGCLGAKVNIRVSPSQKRGKVEDDREMERADVVWEANDDITDGYVCYESAKCLYVAVAVTDNKSTKKRHKRNTGKMTDTFAPVSASDSTSASAQVNMCVHRVIRAYSEIAVFLPARTGSKEVDRVCVLRGQKYNT